MRAHHLYENHIYVVSNHAVARNPIFMNKAYCIRFLRKVDFYLGTICQILHYSLDQNQFHLMVKLKNRNLFCKHYREKKKDASIKDENIPHSSYIFSQAMANLQSSAAIYFNRKEGRTGALFARRYYKHLVESKEELESWVSRIETFQKQIAYTERWKAKEMVNERRNWVVRNVRRRERNAAVYYKYKKAVHPILSTFKRIYSLELQGQFQNLPPKRFILQKSPKFNAFYPHPPP